MDKKRVLLGAVSKKLDGFQPYLKIASDDRFAEINHDKAVAYED